MQRYEGFQLYESSKSLPRGKGFRDGVTWKGGHSPAQKKRTFIDDLYKVLEFVEWYKEWY